MKLHINSSHNTQLHLSLDEEIKTFEYDSPRDQDVLEAIHTFLKQKNAALSDLTEITVNTGPGMFTSLRTGIAIAQSLAFSLNIPINGKIPGTTIEAEYGAPPNITISKKIELTYQR